MISCHFRCLSRYQLAVFPARGTLAQDWKLHRPGFLAAWLAPPLLCPRSGRLVNFPDGFSGTYAGRGGSLQNPRKKRATSTAVSTSGERDTRAIDALTESSSGQKKDGQGRSSCWVLSGVTLPPLARRAPRPILYGMTQYGRMELHKGTENADDD
jgi:hypothetical protein